MPNQIPSELEQSILNVTLQFPTYSYVRVSRKLQAGGVKASPSTVRVIWERHHLTTCQERLRFLQGRTGTLPVRYARLLHSQDSSRNPES